MQITKGDILDVEYGIICHQVNCQGKMGAGIAMSIRNKWPIVYDDYMNAFRKGELKLGYTVFSEVAKNTLYVASLCGQLNYGRHKLHTNYDAVRTCLSELAKYNDGRLTIYIPYRMGCSLAGGDWNIVFKIIEETIPDVIIISK